jgi:hypothetical protein
MKRLSLVCLWAILLAWGCGVAETETKTEEEPCNSVEDCLDRFDFERARKECAEEIICDKKKIIEVESSYMLENGEFEKSKQVAAEIFSLKEMDKVEQNNFYAEKLSDLVAKAISMGKVEEAEKVLPDFPVPSKRDLTVKYHLEALYLVSEDYGQNGNTKGQKQLSKKIKELEGKTKTMIAGLKADIAKLEKDKQKKKKEGDKRLKELRAEKEKALNRLAEIQDSWYMFDDRRQEDLSAQQRVIDDIQSDIDEYESIESDFDRKIEELQQLIDELKGKD